MQPNIILLFSDQQRWDTLGCYGNSFVVTPNIDRIAAQGVRFEHCFTPFPLCTPARATMWTGVLPHKHGVIDNVYGENSSTRRFRQDGGLQQVEVDPGGYDALRDVSHVKETLSGMLRGAGYHTAYFGKWHLGESNPGLFDVWDAFNSQGGHWVDGIHDGEYKPFVQTDQLIQYLQDQAGGNRPFIAVNSYYPPHDPFTAPKRFVDLYRSMGVPFPGYYGAVSALDYDVGRITSALDELGLSENTLLVYYSDHGETFGYRPHGSHKRSCFEDAVRVPLVIRRPGHIRPAQVVRNIVGLEDLMPTLLECAGVEAPQYLDGRSLLPLMRGESPEWRTDYYIENLTSDKHTQRCLRTDTWKLTLSTKGPKYLFNLQDDPEEELNVYDTPRADTHNRFAHFPPFTDVIERLAARMRDRARELDDAIGVELAEGALVDMQRRRESAKA